MAGWLAGWGGGRQVVVVVVVVGLSGGGVQLLNGCQAEEKGRRKADIPSFPKP
jgi:hypothetical protein